MLRDNNNYQNNYPNKLNNNQNISLEELWKNNNWL